MIGIRIIVILASILIAEFVEVEPPLSLEMVAANGVGCAV